MHLFFLDKVRTIRNGIMFYLIRYEKCKEVMQNKTCKLFLNHTSVDKIRKLLKNLKNSRSTSVKISAEVIAQRLHHIISLSIMQSKFPTSWKYSKVIPLHKKESKLIRKNFSPAAILTPFSKIFEKVDYSGMYRVFKKK